MSGIEGKVVVITGASTGIGEATALLLAGRGARVVVGARRTERIAALAERIVAGGGEAIHSTTDVRRRDDVEALVAAGVERFGRVDVLVNNAGIGPISAMDELRVDDWDAMIDVNLKGVLYGIAAVLPRFRAQGSGQIVNVVSTSGLKIVPLQAVYAGTKNAVRTISEGLRQEAGPDLRVTVVSPGMTRTDFADSITSPAVREGIREGMGDVGIAPDAIARAIAFAIEQPGDVDVGDVVVRPTAQG
ncbi:SDR family oxidoreductase [Patulibacter minatonensis]|uniref:SDR family oxidoreductase n=1 Tax=Patulibacter minatonensis TaxID=298163 RepID=UPI00047BBBC5|nr:SDR family oxidoreductase [Patulibacter minatonensis]